MSSKDCETISVAVGSGSTYPYIYMFAPSLTFSFLYLYKNRGPCCDTLLVLHQSDELQDMRSNRRHSLTAFNKPRHLVKVKPPHSSPSVQSTYRLASTSPWAVSFLVAALEIRLSLSISNPSHQRDNKHTLLRHHKRRLIAPVSSTNPYTV